jgi:hypothetical protein
VTVTGTTFKGPQEILPLILKVHRQCPLFLLVEVKFHKGKAPGKEKCKE